MRVRKIILLLLLITAAVPAYAQKTKKERNLIKEGNELFGQGKYAEAEAAYGKVLEFNPMSPIARFNQATATMKKLEVKKEMEPQDSSQYSGALKHFADLTTDPGASKSIREKSFFNLGKISYESEAYQQAVEFLKQALKIDPSDEQALKLLRMAQKKMSQNQDKNQNQKQKDKENKDENKNQQKQQPKQDPPKNQNQNPQPQQQQPNNSQQMLQAVQNEEKNTRDKVNKRKAEQMQGRQKTDKPW